MKKLNGTVVVLSGGLDSTTMLYKMLEEEKDKNKVKALSFNYGQRHKKELEFAKKTTDILNIEHKIINLNSIAELLTGSALTSDVDVPEGHYEDESMKKTVVPNRNAIMANIAIGYAVSLGFSRVALGVHAGDHAIYPDCRPLFVKALSVLAEVANYEPIEILTPYLHVSKVEIIQEGIELGVDYGNTWTCYKGLEKACGKCGSCQERCLAFIENKLQDPLYYEIEWKEIAQNLVKNI